MAEAQAPYDVIMLFVYLLLFGALLSLLYGLSEWLSRDRVLKIFEDKDVLVVLGSEAYYGRLHVPPRSGGGFEVFFPSDRVENPLSLIAFLKENYRETGNKKFLENAERLLEEFKSKGLVDPSIRLEDISVDPWSPPSLVSRKVYPDEVKNLNAIIRFKEFMDKRELKRLESEFTKVYNPPLHWRLKRKLWNALAYVRDRLVTSLSPTTLMPQTMRLAVPVTAPLAITTQVQKDVTELEKRIKEMEMKALATLTEYDALLENALGRLLTVRVVDVEGEEKTYCGVLREYSKNYILLYDVDYKIQMYTRFKGKEECPGYPRTHLKFYGLFWRDEKHLEVANISPTDSGSRVVLRNASCSPLKVEKVRFKVPKEGGVEEKVLTVSRVLQPGETVELSVPLAPEDIELDVEYEIHKEVDIIWPRSKVKVVGLGEYPASLLSEILSSAIKPAVVLKSKIAKRG